MPRILLALAVILLLVLHQDFWFWRTAHPLVFGFLPIGLAYHGLFSIATAALFALLVRHAWPEHLEREVDATEPRTESGNQERRP